MKSSIRSLPLFSMLAALSACSSGSGSPYPYTIGKTNVIGATTTSQGTSSSPIGVSSANGPDVSTSRVGVAQVMTVETPSAGTCIDVGDACVKPQTDCGTADVIVDDKGAVLSRICYPDNGYHVVTLDPAAVTNPPLGNNSVVVLDNLDDGVDVNGDVHITGNNVILYGYGPDVSELGGNLSIDKNNTIVRGVKIDGDVEISKNNAALIDCIIGGNLTITGNNVSLALCEIWGTVTISGENAVFVSNLVLGDQAISGNNLRCNDNHRFTDPDNDGVVQDAEIGDPITCESRGTAVANDPGLSPKK